MGMAFLLPFVAQLEPRSQLFSKLNEIGGKLAAFSYTLYLTHYPLLYVIEHYFPSRQADLNAQTVTWYTLKIASCLVFGWLCYLPFERNTAQVRTWIRTNRGHKCQT